jgi:chemotaxis protein CheD
LTDPLSVGVAELKVSDNSDTLVSFGLGSCVAVAIYDPVRKTGGMAHVMLPESRGNESETAPGKFADTAVPSLVDRLVALGARKRRLLCKIVGGAQMFEIPGTRIKHTGPTFGPHTHIGARNVEAVKDALERAGIPLVGEDTGGRHGRTVFFDTCTGEMKVSSIHYGANAI